jgi:hypothetical protein
MQRLLDGIELDIEDGAGLPIYDGGDKVVLHTTETSPGSLGWVRDSWRGENNWGKGLPHFIVEQGRIVQLLPLTLNAYTLENAAGGSDTNRSGHCIQAEIVHRAGEPWSDAEFDAIGHLLAMLIGAGLEFELDNHPVFYAANQGIILAVYNSPVRFSAQRWTDGNFWAAHVHAPENAHWDIGPINADRVVDIARSYLAGGAPPPTPNPQEWDEMATQQEFEAAVEHATRPQVWITTDGDLAGMCWIVSPVGGTRAYIKSPAELATVTVGPWAYQVQTVPADRLTVMADITPHHERSLVLTPEDIQKLADALSKLGTSPDAEDVARAVIDELHDRTAS